MSKRAEAAIAAVERESVWRYRGQVAETMVPEWREVSDEEVRTVAPGPMPGYFREVEGEMPSRASTV